MASCRALALAVGLVLALAPATLACDPPGFTFTNYALNLAPFNPNCVFQNTGNETSACDMVAQATSTKMVAGSVGGASEWGTECFKNDPGTVGPFSDAQYNVTPADTSADPTYGYPVYGFYDRIPAFVPQSLSGYIGNVSVTFNFTVPARPDVTDNTTNVTLCIMVMDHYGFYDYVAYYSTGTYYYLYTDIYDCLDSQNGKLSRNTSASSDTADGVSAYYLAVAKTIDITGGAAVPPFPRVSEMITVQLPDVGYLDNSDSEFTNDVYIVVAGLSQLPMPAAGFYTNYFKASFDYSLEYELSPPPPGNSPPEPSLPHTGCAFNFTNNAWNLAPFNPNCIYEVAGNATSMCDKVELNNSTMWMSGSVGGMSEWGTTCYPNDPGTVGPFGPDKYNMTEQDQTMDPTPGYPVYGFYDRIPAFIPNDQDGYIGNVSVSFNFTVPARMAWDNATNMTLCVMVMDHYGFWDYIAYYSSGTYYEYYQDVSQCLNDENGKLPLNQSNSIGGGVSSDYMAVAYTIDITGGAASAPYPRVSDLITVQLPGVGILNRASAYSSYTNDVYIVVAGLSQMPMPMAGFTTDYFKASFDYALEYAYPPSENSPEPTPSSPPADSGPLYSFTATLKGSKQMPPIATSATGTATVYWYNETYALGEIRLSKVKKAFMAHIHAGNATTSGPIVVWAWASYAANTTTGAATSNWQYITTGERTVFMSWTFDPSVMSDASGNMSVTEMLMSRTCYFNVHTKAHPAGEIRGQFVKNKQVGTPGFKDNRVCASWVPISSGGMAPSYPPVYPSPAPSPTPGGPMYSFSARLNGYKSVPPHSSVSTADAAVYWYNETYAVGEFRMVYFTDAFMAHIHAGNATTDGPIAVWAWASHPPNPETGASTPSVWQYVSTGATNIVTSWTFDPSIMSGNMTVTDMLMSSTCYFNIHTKAYPAGEARGQFVMDKNTAKPGSTQPEVCAVWI